MQKNITFRRFVYKNSYLPVIAAWLITFSFIIDNYWSGNSSVGAARKNVEQNVQKAEKDFDRLLSDTAALSSLSNNTYSELQLLNLTGKKYFLFRYFINDVGQPQLTFWNTQAVIPSDSLLQSANHSGFTRLQNGYYAWRKVQSARSSTIALIPVKWQYMVTNEYLQNNFIAGNDMAANYDISLLSGDEAVRSIDGNILFYMVKKNTVAIPHNNPLALWLRILGIILVLMFVHLCAGYIATNDRLWKSVLFLLVIIIGVRLVSYYFPFPVRFRQFELFDPVVYGSNMVLRSLGDLLINVLLFVWVVLFLRYQLQEKNINIQVKNPVARWIFIIVMAAIQLAATFISGNIIRSLISDSQISFDVINFFTLNIYSVIGFVVLCCLALGYFYLSQIFLFLVKPLLNNKLTFYYLVIAVGGLAYLTFLLNNGAAGFELIVFAWLMAYLPVLALNFKDLSANRISSSRFVFWLFFFSISITSVIVMENSRKEIRSLEHYAETLSTKADPFNETLLNTLITDFRNDVLAENFDRLRVESSNRGFKDSLVNGNFSGYTNKYDTRVFTFDSKEEPLFNADSTSFNELNAVLNTQGKPTGIPDLFYYDESYDRFSYISRKTVTNPYDSLLGYVFILASQKKSKPDALYPELFSKGHNNAIENSPVYAFAVYNKLQLVSSHNDYAFATRLNANQVPREEFESYKKNGYVELWHKAGPQKVVIIARKNNFVIESITLFSYLFCSFLVITAVLWLMSLFIRSGFNRTRFKLLWQMNIRTQIHGTIIFISVLSFLIIGVATILFFINRYENNNRESLSRTIHVMENEVRNSLADLSAFDDVITIYDPGYRDKLEKMIARVSEIHAADINLYDLDGNLKASSLPLPYNKGIVSTKMDPVAYYHLNRLKEVQYFKKENIGKLDFVSNYIPVIEENGREYVYLNIPYFTSQSKLKQEIANFLVTIINLNAFIFLIAGIVSLFITNRITRSFSIISERMKAINLGRLNEKINWKRKDEIGELVNEYNKMVNKLDESAAALAKSEREGAWREMARQVAHEIKNPLTPMKLSLQYLQKAIDGNSANVKEMTASVAQTLVEQIEHLNHIAGEFSQFANIGNPRNERFDLHDSLQSVIQLYSADQRLMLEWKPMPAPVIINADRTHINRLFTNLVLNAIQAIPADGRQAHVVVEESIGDEGVLVCIRDNGQGIPENLREKIFTPNFTTKTSGTGLGLAMCKGIVEQARGKIWFTTVTGEGTSFYVSLPVETRD